MIMDNDFFTDDGHLMDIDNLTQYAKSKMKELLNEGYCNNDIIHFYDNNEWQRIIKLLIIKT